MDNQPSSDAAKMAADIRRYRGEPPTSAVQMPEQVATPLVGTEDLLGPIYLVLCGYDYDGEDVKAILRTKEEAESVAEKYRNRDHFSYDDVRVQEWHVGEITDRRWEETKP